MSVAMSEFYEGMAEIFETDVNKVNTDLDLQSMAWDSLAIVSTIALVDDCFGVMLNGQSLANCNTIGDIERLISAARG